mgnify:CR=1 FL=1
MGWFFFFFSTIGKVSLFYGAGFPQFRVKAKSASPDDRKDLYDCLIQLQDYLAVCGVEREKMDSLTLAEVGKLTVSATTPLNPSLQGEHPDAKLIDGV